MIISFDLDDTLIPGMKQFPTEARGLWQKLFSREKIRAGTVQLMKTLKAREHRIFVYTTSYRSPAYIRRLFFSYGIYPEMIINKTIHDKTLGERAGSISKYPPAFNIDVHVDDSPGVGMEGERHHFKTIIIAEMDTDWVNNILAQLAKS
jgi:FMN phosphatase YigB (HAD superfamily)